MKCVKDGMIVEVDRMLKKDKYLVYIVDHVNFFFNIFIIRL